MTMNSRTLPVDNLEQRVRNLERRISRMIQVGTVEEVDYPNQKVRVAVGDQRDSAWLRFTAERAGLDRTWWPPTVGEQVMVFAPNGEMAAGVIGDSLYQQDFAAPASEGTVKRTLMGDGAELLYDQVSNALTVNLPGSATVNIGGDASLQVVGNVQAAAAAFTFDGPLTFNGEVVVNQGSIAVPDGDVSAGSISLKQHTHVGDSGGDTGPAK
jgi:phage baseplate assembly protein V